ncbi:MULTISPECIES: hypothetical protein [unclassified Caballeronia]|uniref:hypothetical protein n=1 Tax=unclassified Caballeronia TaxID=2646786 RepID=UPI00285E7A56|nr:MULTISPECIES: hypothetical protein [unclassified Caballeronia]MDR5736327.1 hypothetical protein [Caballeronia sp. LZ016]MDR5811204.1 hypothetical protein [Caballeronia sp. LZ019]
MSRQENRPGKTRRDARHEQRALGAQVAFHAKTGARNAGSDTDSHESPGRYGAGDAQRLKKT